MATLTTNISNVSLTVSGKNTQTATISWTCPTVPAGMIVSSCTLTGNASSFTTGNKGATLTINNTSVSSGSSFTINLGTGNNTTSVQASFTGAHKQTSTSVTLSNLVYTVEYTEPLPTYTVTFKDWDGSVLKTEEVESGSAATAPSNPSREGYDFTGWDKMFSNITSDLTVTAQYSIKTYTVKFYSDSTLLKTETVEHGKSATVPNSPTKEGHTFTGWDKDFTNITSDLSIYALYEINKYTVTFVDYDGTVLKTEEVEYGGSATAPDVYREGYELTGWSVDFSNIVLDITTIAQYVAIDALKIKENGNWTDIGKVYKKVSGNWVEQNNNNWENLFGQENVYKQQIMPTPTAILYSDGSFVFSFDDTVDNSYGDVIATYTGWDEAEYDYNQKAPWTVDEQICSIIKRVYVNNIVSKHMSYWFFDCYNCLSAFIFADKTFNTNNMFDNCQSLTSIDLSNFDTGNVINMKSMFNGCQSLTSLDLSGFNTSNVIDMSHMFAYCQSLTSLDLSNFNTGNVTDMKSMFAYCQSLTSLDLSNFNTGNVTDMKSMFSDCRNLISLDLSNFDTSNIISMNYMFGYCLNLTSLNLSNFNTGNVTDMNQMFSYCQSLTSLDLSNFDTTNVTSTNSMFQGCTNLQTIYVKDETAKTKIEASANFPTGISVIIGKPN